MVFVSNRRSEQGEDAVAGRLDDMAVVAANRVDHQPKSRVDDRAGFFGIEILLQAGRIDDVDEKRGDELPLTLRNEAQVDRLSHGNSRRRCRRLGDEGGATLVAKARSGAVQLPATGAADWQRGAASAAELCRFGVFGFAVYALHGHQDLVALHALRSRMAAFVPVVRLRTDRASNAA